MRIRDAHAILNGCKDTFECPSGGLDIIADDDRTMFSVKLEPSGELSVWSGTYCNHKGKILSDHFVIVPHASNVVHFRKLEQKEDGK